MFLLRLWTFYNESVFEGYVQIACLNQTCLSYKIHHCVQHGAYEERTRETNSETVKSRKASCMDLLGFEGAHRF